MDMKVVGCHALLFNDDAMTTFVNSSQVLVEWKSLSIDRYNFRHLLPSPPRLKRRLVQQLDAVASSLEAYLHHLPTNKNKVISQWFGQTSM